MCKTTNGSFPLGSFGEASGKGDQGKKETEWRGQWLYNIYLSFIRTGLQATGEDEDDVEMVAPEGEEAEEDEKGTGHLKAFNRLSQI